MRTKPGRNLRLTANLADREATAVASGRSPRLTAKLADREAKRVALGFTLAEILIAIGVISIGVLGICSTLALGGRAEAEAARITEATALCREIVDLVRARNLAFTTFPTLPGPASGINDDPTVRRALNATPFASDLASGTPYTRNISTQWVSTSAGDYRNGMVLITAGVYWNDHGTERKVEFQAYDRQP